MFHGIRGSSRPQSFKAELRHRVEGGGGGDAIREVHRWGWGGGFEIRSLCRVTNACVAVFLLNA